MNFNFKNKSILITGASKGIGLEMAKTFAKHKAFVIGTSTSKESVKSITKAIGENGNGFGIKVDFNFKEDINIAFQYIKKYGKLPDILINNAGITDDHLMLRLSEKKWKDVINVNLNSVFKISQMFMLRMIKKKWGRIINIGSVVASSGNAGQTNYCASKAGIIGLSKALAQEVASRNITVNVISPGFIKTDMTEILNDKQKIDIISKIPLKSMGQTKDIASMALYLASNYAGYITGQTLHVNGGMYMI